MYQITDGIEPRMDGNTEQRFAWRLMALREALAEVASVRDGHAEQQIAANALFVDNENVRVPRSTTRLAANP